VVAKLRLRSSSDVLIQIVAVSGRTVAMRKARISLLRSRCTGIDRLSSVRESERSRLDRVSQFVGLAAAAQRVDQAAKRVSLV